VTELRSILAAHGGLVSTADLAARWRISRQRALQLSRRPDFPQPVYTSTSQDRPRALWLADEVDAFHRSYFGPSNRLNHR